MHKKEVFAWGMYDLANTAFSALFVTFFFPLYIKHYLGGTEFQIGLVFGLSMLLVAVLVPIIGALSDETRRRMPFIILFTTLCCVFTYLVSYGNLKLALLFGFLANFFYHAALTAYNAILPSISEKRNIGMVSGIGVAMGYLGTFFSLIVAWLLLSHYGWESIMGIKSTFIATAIFFFSFSLITFFFIREKPMHDRRTFWKIISTSFGSVKKTFVQFRKYKNLTWFVCSMFMYVNAINAVIVFLYLYGRSEIGLSVKHFMIVFVIFAIASAIGAFIAGRVSDRIGPKKTLGIAGLLWLVTLVVLLKISSLEMFIVSGVLGGIALGAVWTAVRPMLVALSPRKNIGQFFGFMETIDKFSGVIGPIIFGYLATAYNYDIAISSLFAFFFLGLILLQKVKSK